MRLVGRGSLLLGAIALLGFVAFAGCQNPLDPLDESDKIEGLSYIGFGAATGAWNSDPGDDGLIIDMDYTNEFGDGLSFHDKPHDVIIELWTQVSSPEGEPAFETKGDLIFSRTIRYSNSDDSIRLPIEAYYQAMLDAGLPDESGAFTGFMVVRVHPPQDYPRSELLVAQPDVDFWIPQTAEDTPQ
jgi:hypothetical protein